MATKKVEVALDGAKATVEVKEPPKKKCALTDVLPESVIPLVRAAPNNETIRNLLLAHLRVPVPATEDTFEKVKHWIEFNVEPLPPVSRGVPLPPPPTRARPEDRIMVASEVSEHSWGTCSYSEDESGTGNIPIEPHELLEAAEEADDPDAFFEAITQVIYDDDPRSHVQMDTVDGTRTHSDYEPSDSDGLTVEIQEPGKTALKAALRRLSPELYQRLFPS